MAQIILWMHKMEISLQNKYVLQIHLYTFIIKHGDELPEFSYENETV